MLFNSLEFAVFFPLVTIAYFVLPHRYRLLLLLVASCYFYMAFIPIYVVVLWGLIIVDYLAGILIDRLNGGRRKSALAMSLAANLGVLAVFKYFNFFNENLAGVASWLHVNYPIQDLSIVLPIGLSFHTFQSMSYTIEVYYKRQQVVRNFRIYATYVMFYPQLVAGPIERPQNLLHQFSEVHQFDYSRAVDGLRLITWGLFKKLVIADRLAILVDQVYDKPTSYTGFPLILATYAFAVQIYCDFSGYSDIAIGAARVMGFSLMQNFKQPYFSQSISEFWTRWHISLSTWFRDYVYIPLGGNRVNNQRRYLNLISVFILSGFWHGANWTFVAWGMLHAAYMIFDSWFRIPADKLRTWQGFSVLRILLTFHAVAFAWIFFRAKSMDDAIYVATHLFDDFRLARGNNLGLSDYDYVVLASAILLMGFVEWLQRTQSANRWVAQKPVLFRWSIYYGLVMAILLFGRFAAQQFIYFQF